MTVLSGVQKNVLKRTWLQASWCLCFLLFVSAVTNQHHFPCVDLAQAEEMGSKDLPFGNELLVHNPEEMLSFDTRNTLLTNYANNSAQALCQENCSSGPHLYFSLKCDGSYELLDGVKLSGFSLHAGRDSYDSDRDYFWLEKKGTKYCAWHDLKKPAVADTCSVPASLKATEIGETTALLNWGSGSSAQSYDIRYKSTSDNSWLSTSSATNSVKISSLTAATENEFQVRSRCSGETSDYSVSAYFTTYDGVPLKTIGETTVFSTPSDAANRRAVRYTMPEDGTIESITVYHKAGSGNMILGIYDGEDDPVNLLGKTDSVAVSRSDGWQTVELQFPVFVSGGETIWLAWVLETNDGILVHESGEDPRSEAGVGWSAGMPDSFGSSSLANYDYSIYASYSPGATQACGVPSRLGTTSITDNSAILTWSEAPSATEYRIQYREVGSDTWTAITSSSPSADISGLAAETHYEFQVQLICSSGDSDYSDAITFTTLSGGERDTVGNTDYATYEPQGAQDCAPPSGLEATEITPTSWVLGWDSVSSATGYLVQYRRFGEDWTTTTSSSASVELTDLASDTLYEFQIQAICLPGDSPYSSIVEFVTVGGQTTEFVGHTTVFDTTTE
jgi:hypothetical protein